MDEISYKKYIAVAVPYGSALSLLYLWGYWGPFNINILEFVGFSELAKLALYPFLASFIFILFSVAFAEVMRGDSLPPGGGAETRIGDGAASTGAFLSA